MSSTRLKQLEDLPQFLVRTIKQDEVGPDGYIHFELTGTFDSLAGVREGRCWLLLPCKQSLIGNLASLDPKTNTAVYQTLEKVVPSVQGFKLPYLDGYWQAHHIWMVMDASYPWRESIFNAADAVFFTCEGSDGRTLRGLRRAKPEDVHNPELQIVQNGWDHEHCELCNQHINNPGDTCYCGETRYWVCRDCYQKYVRPHDLSFMDGI
jgi:hypothetical protein